MNKQEFIEKLKMHGAWCTDCHDINGEKDRYVKVAKVRELLEQLDEPQAEKVEVPSCMGEFLDHYDIKEDVSMHIVMKDFVRSDYFSSFCKLNFQDHPMGWDRLMASALMFGYTVKPKRWVVKSKDHIGLESFINGTVNPMWTTEEPLWMTFTDKSKAEAVAILVEGSVEEI